MLRSGTAPRKSAAVLILLLPLWAGLHGCATPPTRPVAVPGGGQVLVLDFSAFQSTVSPILERQGCDAGGDCHGGGIRGTLQLSPQTAKDTLFDFHQVSLQVTSNAPDQSPILTAPLAVSSGGTAHSVKVFADTNDTEWRAIRAWVRAGVSP